MLFEQSSITITPEVVWKEVSNVLEEITHDNY
jgi:hypothetical protein